MTRTMDDILADQAKLNVLRPAPTYIYRWNRQGRKGQPCEVTARGTMNSCCVRFEDGYTMITSRNALKKAAAGILAGSDE